MKRRNFLHTTAALSVGLPATQLSSQPDVPMPAEGQELIELRTYAMAFRGNRVLLTRYLYTVLKPTLERKGITKFMVFEDAGDQDPKQYRVLIAYPDANTYVAAQQLSDDEAYNKAAKEYHAVPADQPIFTRYTSSLSLAIAGMPAVADPVLEAGLFELRFYEGYSEDAVRRKIQMFNKEELVLFHNTGLIPVFFGKMLAGPYRPCLVYMLSFKDREERDANWGNFLRHPDWIAMKNKEVYANTVSNIRRFFLRPV